MATTIVGAHVDGACGTVSDVSDVTGAQVRESPVSTRRVAIAKNLVDGARVGMKKGLELS